jgi:NADH-quinone oxidoreductase subunit C/D
VAAAQAGDGKGPDADAQAVAHRMVGSVSRGTLESRPRYEGVYLQPPDLLPVLRFLHDELGYGMLSNLTAVDYPDAVDGSLPHLDIVYHLTRVGGGGYVVLHVQTARDEAVLPSATPMYPSANLQEREVWDMFGVQFDGHPDLRRLLTWEGFDGFPLRKDWREGYYEEEHKPFRSRFPEGGSPLYAEQRGPARDDVPTSGGRALNESSLDVDFSEADQRLYERMLAASGEPVVSREAEEIILDMAPHHPSTHGVLRVAVRLDGDTVRHLEPVLGYLHRSHEKIGERNTWLQNIPYTNRLDYVNGMTSSLAYCLAMEKLLGWEVPERAEYLRVILSELSRVVNHLLAAGFFSDEIGLQVTGSLYALKERELVLDLFESVSGGRMMHNMMRPGGVVRDVSNGWLDQVSALVGDRMPKRVRQMQALLLDNEMVWARSVGIGALTAGDVIASGVTGPPLRACGVAYDIRRVEPYGIYERLNFDVPIREHGDVFDRVAVRFDEIWQSLSILAQALDAIPEGPVLSHRLSPMMRVPAGETYGRIEAPKGELGFYLVSDGSANPYRYHIRAASLLNLTPLSQLTREVKVADLGPILASVDLAMGEVDR